LNIKLCWTKPFFRTSLYGLSILLFYPVCH